MTIKEKISLFPHSPGVYRYYDSEGNVIYVGKAKDLHKRVAQYFVAPDRLTRKTAVMVSKIADAQYTVVESEADALLLENNLIKQFKPRYNILLHKTKFIKNAFCQNLSKTRDLLSKQLIYTCNGKAIRVKSKWRQI